jgi:hypothetical protein
MQKSDVKLGGVYTAKVTNKIVPVRIDAESRYGGWDGTNLSTGKKVRIKSPTKLRAEVEAVAVEGQATPQADQENVAANAADAATADPDVANPGAKKGKTAKARGAANTKNRKRATKADKGAKRMSGLDAAAKVLEESGEPMNVKEMVETAEQKGYWKSPGGKTPQATVYSAIIREIKVRGKDARFRKTERGRFVHA